MRHMRLLLSTKGRFSLPLDFLFLWISQAFESSLYVSMCTCTGVHKEARVNHSPHYFWRQGLTEPLTLKLKDLARMADQ